MRTLLVALSLALLDINVGNTRPVWALFSVFSLLLTLSRSSMPTISSSGNISASLICAISHGAVVSESSRGRSERVERAGR